MYPGGHHLHTRRQTAGNHRLIAISGGKVAGIGTPRELLTAEFIKKLYGVDSRVDIEESTGRMNIVYLPRHWKKETPQVST